MDNSWFPKLVTALESEGNKVELEDSEPAVARGNNFASDVVRVAVRMRAANETSWRSKKYIIKTELSDEKGKKLNETGMNKVEHKVRLRCSRN